MRRAQGGRECGFAKHHSLARGAEEGGGVELSGTGLQYVASSHAGGFTMCLCTLCANVLGFGHAVYKLLAYVPNFVQPSFTCDILCIKTHSN